MNILKVGALSQVQKFIAENKTKKTKCILYVGDYKYNVHK